MSDANARRTGRLGGVFVALIVGGSAAGVIGWYVHTNRAPAIDASGFDLSAAPQSHHAASASPTPVRSASGLSLLKGGAGVRIVDSNTSSSGGKADEAAFGKGADKKEQSRADVRAQWREHEADLWALGDKMSQKYPVILQYENDWMSHPDLRKLTEDYYLHGHDPVAFLMGLAQAPNLGVMVKQYAGSPWITEFVAQGVKETPKLTSSVMTMVSNDAVVKTVVTDVAGGLGLPPSVTGLIDGSGDPDKVDQKQVGVDAARPE